jgi:hypothetical protein
MNQRPWSGGAPARVVRASDYGARGLATGGGKARGGIGGSHQWFQWPVQ